ncbi:MAG: cobalamin-dependent protein [Desulfobulbaceae bacterium]|jgi:anaerobic magnesium-protoporphyrin IX monomethyl ester cyclase|nr:cobalamin-dependent protein [Desulfobulbaceae bacterium]
MQHILLVQLPTSTFTSEKVYPLGLARLSSLVPRSMDKAGLDLNLFGDPWPVLDEKLRTWKPDLVGFSFRNMDPLAQIHSSYFPVLQTAVNLARRRLPEARIICGGPGFSLFAEPILELLPSLDYGIRGEGEAGFPLLLKPNVAQDIPGLVFRHQGSIVSNTNHHADLNELPELDTELFPPADYLRKNEYVAAMGVEGKRGCSLTCGYCTYPALGGNKSRLRDPLQVVDDMEECRRHGARIIHFTDSVVNRPAHHLRAICKEILARNLDMQWTGFFREDHLDQELADLAVQAGLVTFYFSGDSLTSHGLHLLQKNLCKEDLFNAARITARTGVITCYHFMANLPGETETHHEEGRQTLETLFAIHQPAANLGAIILSSIRLYPGSPLTTALQQQGLLENINLLYPTYYNPQETSHRLHELIALCHERGIQDRLVQNP